MHICDAHTVWGGKSDRKRTLTIPRHKWEYNFKIGFQEIWREGVDCIYLAQDRKMRRAVVNRIMNPQVP
jgi:hypothetical protein